MKIEPCKNFPLIYGSSKIFDAQNFRNIAKNHMNVNFSDKFRDRYNYCCVVAPARTIHVVAPPTILTCGVGLGVLLV